MAARRRHVQLVAAIDTVAEPIAKVLHEFLIGFALEYEQILDCELLILAPAQSEPTYTRSSILGVERGGVQ